VSFRRLVVGLGLAIATSAAPLGADEGIARLQGVWATSESVLDDRATIWEGSALYLLANGRGALVGAGPLRDCDGQRCAPRIGVPFRLLADASGWRLAVDGASVQMRLSQDADGRGVLLQLADGKQLRLQRRSTELPEQLQRELGADRE
jgi:hypothetical protein